MLPKICIRDESFNIMYYDFILKFREIFLPVNLRCEKLKSCEVKLKVLFSLSLVKSDNICFTGAKKTQRAHCYFLPGLETH